MIPVISLGAGVQSSTMAIMASKGLIKNKPVCAIFADTQSEPSSVYKYLEFLKGILDFPILIGSRGSLAGDAVKIRRSKKSGRLYQMEYIPAYSKSISGKLGMLQRRCTYSYKVDVIHRILREEVLKKKQVRSKNFLIEMWIGISKDEAHRMKPSRMPWIQNRWPLIELGMTRDDCLKFMESNNILKPPRSACVFCPYHSDSEWLRLKNEEPEDFKKAIEFEKKFREARKLSEVSDGDAFLHKQCIPLDQVIFDKNNSTKSGFGNECEGLCGV